jgi:hypothetical protein
VVVETRVGIEDAIVMVDGDIEKVRETLGELQLAGSSSEAVVQEYQDNEVARNQLEGEETTLQTIRKRLEDLLPKTEEKAINEAASQAQHSVQATFGDNYSGS